MFILTELSQRTRCGRCYCLHFINQKIEVHSLMHLPRPMRTACRGAGAQTQASDLSLWHLPQYHNCSWGPTASAYHWGSIHQFTCTICCYEHSAFNNEIALKNLQSVYLVVILNYIIFNSFPPPSFLELQLTYNVVLKCTLFISFKIYSREKCICSSYVCDGWLGY